MSEKFRFESSKEKDKIRIFPKEQSLIESGLISGAHIEMLSNKRISIDGCCGVLEYNEGYIRLNLGKGTITLSGLGLDIVSYENRLITIRGTITALEFC